MVLILISLRRDICRCCRQYWCILVCLKRGEKCPRCGSSVGYVRDDRRDQSARCQRSDGWSEFEIFYSLWQVRQLHILYLLRYIHVLHGRDSTRGRCCDSRLHTPYRMEEVWRMEQFQKDLIND